MSDGERGADGDAPADPSDDVATLSAENARLRAELERASRARPGRSRRLTVRILLVVGTVLLIAAGLAVWVERLVLDTDEFVDTTRQIARREAVADALAAGITEQIFAEVEIDELTRDALPEDAEILAGPISGAVRSFTETAVREVIRSREFETLWTEAVRLAHESAVDVVTGTGDVARAEDGRVVLDLDALVAEALERLSDRGLTLFEDGVPVELGTFVLFEGGQVEVAEEAVDLLDALATWLPLLALASFGGAVWLATDRRRGAAQIGIAIAIAMAVTLVVARISRGEVLGGIDLERRRDAADEVWDVVVGSLVRQTVAVLLVGLLVAFVAWVVGPSRRATWLRTTTREQLRAVREGPLEGRTPTGLVAFVRPRRRALQGWTLALAFLVLWLVPEATPGIVVLVAAVVLVVVLAIELVGGGPGTRAPTGPRDDETAQPPGGGTGVRS